MPRTQFFLLPLALLAPRIVCSAGPATPLDQPKRFRAPANLELADRYMGWLEAHWVRVALMSQEKQASILVPPPTKAELRAHLRNQAPGAPDAGRSSRRSARRSDAPSGRTSPPDRCEPLPETGRASLELVLSHLEFERRRDGHASLRRGDFRADPRWNEKTFVASVASDCKESEACGNKCLDSCSPSDDVLRLRSFRVISLCRPWRAAIRDYGNLIAPPGGGAGILPGFQPHFLGPSLENGARHLRLTRIDLAQLLTAYFANLASNRRSASLALGFYRKLADADGYLTMRAFRDGLIALRLYRADEDHNRILDFREIYGLASDCPDFSKLRALLTMPRSEDPASERAEAFKRILAGSLGTEPIQRGQETAGVLERLRMRGRIHARVGQFLVASAPPEASGAALPLRQAPGPMELHDGAEGAVGGRKCDQTCKQRCDFPSARLYRAHVCGAEEGLFASCDSSSSGAQIDGLPKTLEAVLVAQGLGNFPTKTPGVQLGTYLDGFAANRLLQLQDWCRQNNIDVPDQADSRISFNDLAVYLQAQEDQTGTALIKGSGFLTVGGLVVRGQRRREGGKDTHYRGKDSMIFRLAKDAEGTDAKQPAFFRLTSIAQKPGKREYSFAALLDFYGEKDRGSEPRWRAGFVAQRLDPTGNFTKRYTYLAQRRVYQKEIDFEQRKIGIGKVDVGWALDRSLDGKNGETRKRRWFVKAVPEFRLPLFGSTLATNRLRGNGRGWAPFTSLGVEFNDVYRAPLGSPANSNLDHPFYVGTLGLKGVTRHLEFSYSITGRSATDDSDLDLTYESAALNYKFRDNDRVSLSLNYQQGRDGKVDRAVEQFIVALGVQF